MAANQAMSPMKRYLNGWRRLGVCLLILWIALVSIIAIFQYTTHAKGFFVYWSLPIGTVAGDGKATLPNGKVVTIDDVDPTTGKHLDPTQVDWDHQPNVPSVAQILWLRLVRFVVIIPLVAWALAELTTAAVRWIRAGFRHQSSGA